MELLLAIIPVLLTFSFVEAFDSLLFMQGSTQGLGTNKLWSLNLTTLRATERWKNDYTATPISAFSSRGCVCSDGAYYTLWWHLVEPNHYAGPRVYGIARFDISNNYTFTQHKLSNSYYGVWCGRTAGELVLAMSPRPNQDPEEVSNFYVQTISTSTWAIANVTTTPLAMPPMLSQQAAVADGIFDFDVASNTMWVSWAVDAFPHLDAGVTVVVDLATSKHTTYYTSIGEGYFVNARATDLSAAGSKTWAVTKKIGSNGKVKLHLVAASLADGKSSLGVVSDVSRVANSYGYPLGECVQLAANNKTSTTTLYSFNADERDFLHPWFNMSSVDAATGNVHWNLDTFAIVSEKFAWVTGFACI